MLELILLLIPIFVCIHIKYRVNMTDLLQQLQGVYHKWENQSKKNLISNNDFTQSTANLWKRRASLPVLASAARPPPTYVRRTSCERRKLSYGSRNSSFHSLRDSMHTRSDALAQFKVLPTCIADNVFARPEHGTAVCPRCFPSTKKSQLEEKHLLGFANILKVSTSNSHHNYLIRKFHHLVHCWRIHANFNYPGITKNVLSCEQVKTAIENAASRDLSELALDSHHLRRLLRKHEVRAANVLKLMKANISCLLIRFTAWILFKVLGRILTSIQVHKGQIEVIREFAKSNVPIIYLPLHRSHLDYILITFILFNEEIKAPLVAAGDNLRLPIFSLIMRGLGAYFIKRKLDPKDGKRDFVYRAVLNSYMTEKLTSGHSMEFFIEGGRSRSGKACLPKAGLLSVVMSTFLGGGIEDAYVVPIGISYEKLLDGSFLSEQMGKTKVKESFSSTVKGIWNVFRANYGSVRVDFAHPFSLREFVNAAQTYVQNKPRLLRASGETTPLTLMRSVSSTASLYGTDVDIEDQRLLVKGLAEHVLFDAVEATALMSTNLVSFLLLNKYRKGVLFRSLVRDFDWLRGEVKKRKRDVGFTGESNDVVRYALNLLGPSAVIEESPSDATVQSHLAFVKPVLSLPGVFNMSYYSNVVLSVFLKDAVLACSLSALLGDDLEALHGLKRDILVSKQQLLDKALNLCEILQYEFILCPPCTTIETTLHDAIEDFVHAEIFIPEDQFSDRISNRCNRIACRLEWEDDDDDDEDDDDESDEFELDKQQFKVNLNTDTLERLRLFRNVVSSFLESYWQLGACLPRLINTEMEENEFVRTAQRSTMEKIEQGLVEYGECISADTMRNGLRLFSNWKVIDSSLHDSVKVIFLTDNYNNEGSVNNVLEILEDFRK